MTEPIIKPTSPKTEKPAYEAPLVMDLNKVQTGEGGLVSCAAGSAATGGCFTGAGVPL